MHATPSTAPAAQPAASPDRRPRLAAVLAGVHAGFARIPHSLVAALARFAVAAVFWNSGQTKVQGLAVNFISGEFEFGWPRLSENAVFLFREEYRLPLIPPEPAALMAAAAEHLFPLLILLGLGTRLSALALLVMTAVIQFFVYPGAYATHATWAALLLYLMARGPGRLSLDAAIARRRGAAP